MHLRHGFGNCTLLGQLTDRCIQHPLQLLLFALELLILVLQFSRGRRYRCDRCRLLCLHPYDRCRRLCLRLGHLEKSLGHRFEFRTLFGELPSHCIQLGLQPLIRASQLSVCALQTSKGSRRLSGSCRCRCLHQRHLFDGLTLLGELRGRCIQLVLQPFHLASQLCILFQQFARGSRTSPLLQNGRLVFIGGSFGRLIEQLSHLIDVRTLVRDLPIGYIQLALQPLNL